MDCGVSDRGPPRRRHLNFRPDRRRGPIGGTIVSATTRPDEAGDSPVPPRPADQAGRPDRRPQTVPHSVGNSRGGRDTPTGSPTADRRPDTLAQNGGIATWGYAYFQSNRGHGVRPRAVRARAHEFITVRRSELRRRRSPAVEGRQTRRSAPPIPYTRLVRHGFGRISRIDVTRCAIVSSASAIVSIRRTR